MKAKLGLRPAPAVKVQRQTAPAGLLHKTAVSQQPALRVLDGGFDGGMLLRLQAAAGNQAVGQLITGPQLHVQTLSLGTMLRPAEAAANLAASVGVSETAGPKAAESAASMAAAVGKQVAGEIKPEGAAATAGAAAGELGGGPAKPSEAQGPAGLAVGEAVAGARTGAGATAEKVAGPGEAASATPKPGETAGMSRAVAIAGPAAGAAPAVPSAPLKAPAPGGKPGPAAVEADVTGGAPAEAAGEVGAEAGRPANPHDDPHFAAVAKRVGGAAATQKRHPPARAKVAESENAAKGPGNEVASLAAANKVDEMGAQKPKGFDKAAFIAAVNAAIERKSPKTMTEVRDFKESGKAAEVKSEVAGNVAAGKEAAGGAIKASAQAPPNPAGIAPKPVTPMAPEAPGPHPADAKAAEAVPAPKPEAEVSLDHTKKETDGQLAEANVTPEQVAESNEPQFHEAMDAKKEADDHAASAPQKFREDEQKQLGEAKSAAVAGTATGLAEMHQSRASALGHVGTHKDAAKAKNEAERAKVAAELETIYNATKKDVDDILGGLDEKVATTFDQGEKSARDAFENDYETKRSAYFSKRYKGLRGKYRWGKDKLLGPPDEVNDFIVQAKQLYVSKMEAVINDVANIVEAELNRATERIDEGRKQVTDYVNKQPKELKKIASEASSEISSKFDALDQAVSDKASDVVDDLADKYTSAMKEVDDRCNEMREENKGLLDKAKDKIKGMIEAIGKVKDMLSQMADKAAAVIGDIIAHPIRFLENLIGALKQGFGQFVDNIGKHLAEGLMGWLLGELGAAGITLPESFDLKGILHFVAQILGLTWENIRARATEMLGPEVVGMIEQGVGMFQKVAHIFTTIREQGLAGLWDMISDKIGDLKSAVMDQIQDFVIVKVITAGVKWILGLMNPVGAFIKACMAIYDIVMFFISHGSEILALVNTILDNLAAIVAGNIGAAANLVESVLGKAIPMVIGFLASLLGVGGIGEKIKEVINAVRKPINKAVDWVLKSVVKPVAKMAARAVGWVKGKAKSAKDWLKKKGSAAVNKIKSKFAKPDERTPEQRAADRDAGLAEGTALLENENLSPDEVRERLAPIKAKYRLTELRLVTESEGEDSEADHIEAAASPGKAGPTVKKKKDPELQKAREDVRALKRQAVSDPDAVWRLLDLYRSLPDPILRKLAKSDEVARKTMDERILSRPPREIDEDYRPPHHADAVVKDGSGRVVWGPTGYQSGGVTLALIAVHGWRRAAQLTHTEPKACEQAPLAAGLTLYITGQYDPCSSCQGIMRAAAAASGGRVNYWWPGGVWRTY